MWLISETIFAEYPHYLAASGAPVDGTMPGISLHTELEMLVRLGLSSREALAAATNNYAIQFGWNELGLVAPGRRADILVVDADPTVSIWNARRISLLDCRRRSGGSRCAVEVEKVSAAAFLSPPRTVTMVRGLLDNR